MTIHAHDTTYVAALVNKNTNWYDSSASMSDLPVCPNRCATSSVDIPSRKMKNGLDQFKIVPHQSAAERMKGYTG